MREKTKDVWSEAWNLVQRWEKLTREIEESVSRNEMEKLAPLLDERQQLSDQLDALKAAGQTALLQATRWCWQGLRMRWL